MNIYEKAKELGEMISDSQELQNLRLAEDTILHDGQALQIFNDFSAIRQEYMSLLDGTEDEGKLEESRSRLVAKNEELMKNATTRNYMDAKTTVDNIFKSVTDILMKAVNGSDEQASGCGSSGCGDCGGGCH
jgi:cell fate (sporulation/competence/biofilm development) regulator YlbF (YheA/YmcA/DUF963 family)